MSRASAAGASAGAGADDDAALGSPRDAEVARVLALDPVPIAALAAVASRDGLSASSRAEAWPRLVAVDPAHPESSSRAFEERASALRARERRQVDLDVARSHLVPRDFPPLDPDDPDAAAPATPRDADARDHPEAPRDARDATDSARDREARDAPASTATTTTTSPAPPGGHSPPTKKIPSPTREKLSLIIQGVLATHPGECRYYQGLHDVAAVLLLACGDAAAAVLDRLVAGHLRDNVRGGGLDAVLRTLKLLPRLIAAADPELHAAIFPANTRDKTPAAAAEERAETKTRKRASRSERPGHLQSPSVAAAAADGFPERVFAEASSSSKAKVDDEPDSSSSDSDAGSSSSDASFVVLGVSDFHDMEHVGGCHFAVSWLLTWHAHGLDRVADAARLFDLFLASDPLMPLYVGAAAVVADRDALLSLARGETPSAEEGMSDGEGEGGPEEAVEGGGEGRPSGVVEPAPRSVGDGDASASASAREEKGGPEEAVEGATRSIEDDPPDAGGDAGGVKKNTPPNTNARAGRSDAALGARPRRDDWAVVEGLLHARLSALPALTSSSRGRGSRRSTPPRPGSDPASSAVSPAVSAIVRAALALHARVPPRSLFAAVGGVPDPFSAFGAYPYAWLADAEDAARRRRPRARVRGLRERVGNRTPRWFGRSGRGRGVGASTGTVDGVGYFPVRGPRRSASARGFGGRRGGARRRCARRRRPSPREASGDSSTAWGSSCEGGRSRGEARSACRGWTTNRDARSRRREGEGEGAGGSNEASTFRCDC